MSRTGCRQQTARLRCWPWEHRPWSRRLEAGVAYLWRSYSLRLGGRRSQGRRPCWWGLVIPRRGPLEGCAFRRVMRPQGVAIAILNMALWMRLDERRTITSARLAAGPAGPTPRRALEAEAVLCGQPADRVRHRAGSGRLDARRPTAQQCASRDGRVPPSSAWHFVEFEHSRGAMGSVAGAVPAIDEELI